MTTDRRRLFDVSWRAIWKIISRGRHARAELGVDYQQSRFLVDNVTNFYRDLRASFPAIERVLPAQTR